MAFNPFKNFIITKKIIPLLISFLICIIVITIYNLEDRDYFKVLRIFRAIELKSLDIRFQMRGKRDPGSEIVIVKIDEKSIDKIGRYPWPRHYIAQFVNIISDAGARLLAFDVMYTEKQNVDILKTFDDLSNKYKNSSLWNYLPEMSGENGFLSALHREREFLSVLQREKERYDDDSKLVKELEKAVVKGMDIISAINFVEAGGDTQNDFTGKKLSDVGEELLKESAYFPVLISLEEKKRKSIETDGDKLTVLTPEDRKEIMDKLLSIYKPKKAIGVVNLIDLFAEWVSYQGFADTNTDYSGIVRSEYMAIQYQNEFYPPLGVQVARVYKGLNYGELKLLLTKKVIFKDTEITIDTLNRMNINYCGPAYTFKYHSFYDVINGKIPDSEFRNKIVFLGATAEGIGDYLATPFSSQTPGVEKHATVVENILHEKFVVRNSVVIFHDLMAILLLSLAMGIILPILPSIWGGIASVVTLLGYSYYTYLNFINDGTWLNMTYPNITVILCYSSIILYRFVTEEKRRKEVKGAFENFMDPKVVNEILKDPENIKLGGEEKEITVLFSDIEKFSTISEALSPSELIELLNEYLSEMTDVILEQGGYLDKYIGDAIVAVFGAPLLQVDHAVKACFAAIDNQKKLIVLNKKFKEMGKLQINARIGLNTGKALVGNVGSTNRLSYTVIGDEVNLGARLEAANKYYGTYTMISESTYKLAKDHVEARELDKIRVVGKKNPITVYELIDRKGEMPESKREVIEIYEKGLNEYQNWEWQKAIDMFKDALAKDPGDGPSRSYIKRCKEYLKAPPPDDWDGVYTLLSK